MLSISWLQSYVSVSLLLPVARLKIENQGTVRLCTVPSNRILHTKFALEALEVYIMCTVYTYCKEVGSINEVFGLRPIDLHTGFFTAMPGWSCKNSEVCKNVTYRRPPDNLCTSCRPSFRGWHQKPLSELQQLSKDISGFSGFQPKFRLLRKTSCLAAKWWTRSASAASLTPSASSPKSSPASRKVHHRSKTPDAPKVHRQSMSTPHHRSRSRDRSRSRGRPRSRDGSQPGINEPAEPPASESVPQKSVGAERSLSNVTLADAVRHSIAAISASEVARRHCHSEDFRLRVHAAALRLVDCIEKGRSGLLQSSEEMPPVYDTKVIAQAIYGVAYSWEDDEEVSNHSWTQRSNGIKKEDVVKMEWRILDVYFREGKGSLRSLTCPPSEHPAGTDSGAPDAPRSNSWGDLLDAADEVPIGWR